MYFLDKDKLEDEYKEAFSKVEAYSVVQGVKEEDEEEMLANLVDMLYTAQVEGKPVEKIIGNDIEKFCKQYFAEYSGFGKLFSNVPAMVYRIMWFMLFCSVLEFIALSKKGTVDILMASTDVSSFMVGILTCIVSLFLTMILLKPILFRLKKINVLVVSIIQLVIAVLLVAVLVVFMGDKIFSAPLYMVLLGGIGYVVIYKTLVLYKRYKKTGSVKKEVNEDSFRYLMKESFQTTVDTELPVEFKKIFLNKNEKLRKKGKKELTQEEYMEFLL